MSDRSLYRFLAQAATRERCSHTRIMSVRFQVCFRALRRAFLVVTDLTENSPRSGPWHSARVSLRTPGIDSDLIIQSAEAGDGRPDWRSRF